MTLIACVADSHFAEDSRFDECCRLHDWIADDLELRHPDLIVHAGDVFERKSTPKERLAVARWLRRCADIAPVLVVRGNHDVLGDLPIFARLRGAHPIIVEEAAAVHVVAGVAVAAMAWPRKSEILARLGPTSSEASEQTAAEALRAVLRGLGDQLAQHEGPRILLSHAMVRASRTGLGQPLVGCDFELGLEDLALARADAYLLGHIHLGQDWLLRGVTGAEPRTAYDWSARRVTEPEACQGGTNADGAPVVYPGSPRRTAYGELEPKGYVVLGVDPSVCGCSMGFKLGACGVCENRGRVAWDRVEVPATPMLLLQDEWGVVFPEESDAVGFRVGDFVARDADARGAEIRFRYTVDADQRDAARAGAEKVKADLLALGAIEVKLEEEVRSVNRARAPEVSKAKTLEEKLELLWKTRGFDPGPRREALLEKARGLKGAA